MRIGVLGGTFDPPHLGHVRIAESAIREQKLDHVLVLPAGDPYHKSDHRVSPAVYRYEMSRLAFRKASRIRLSDLDLRRDKPTYTLDTLHELRRLLPGKPTLALIYGSDVLFTIRGWHKAEELLKEAPCILARRKEDSPEMLRSAIRELQNDYGAVIRLLEARQLPFSSTQIRRARIQEGRAIYTERLHLLLTYLRQRPDMSEALAQAETLSAGLANAEIRTDNWRQAVHKDVAAFIDVNELYIKEHLLLALQERTLEQLQRMDSGLRRLLGPQRLIHSWNVLFTALELALRFGADPDQAALAALAHDCAKERSLKEMQALIQERRKQAGGADQSDGQTGESAEKSGCAGRLGGSPALLHGPAGAELAARLFHLDDKAIAAAISYHTTLRPEAGKLEKIIYLADKMEPARSYGDLREIRAMSKRHLEAATLLCLRGAGNHLLRHKLAPHSLSVGALRAVRRALQEDPDLPEELRRQLALDADGWDR